MKAGGVNGRRNENGGRRNGGGGGRPGAPNGSVANGRRVRDRPGARRIVREPSLSFGRGVSRDDLVLGRTDLWSPRAQDRKSTRLNSSHSQISYAVFSLKKN